MYLARDPLFAILVVSRGERSRLPSLPLFHPSASPAMLLGRERRKRLSNRETFRSSPSPPPALLSPSFACIFAIVSALLVND